MTKKEGSIGILFLGGAKRVSMGRHFINAAGAYGLKARLFSYELDENVPISTIATIILGKKWSDPDIISHLETVIERHDIDIIIPFVDGAVEIAARIPSHSCYAPVCTPAIATMMFDKVLAAQLFEHENLPIPRTYTKGAPRYPLIAKPRFGSASRGLKIINSPSDFRAVDLTANLVQEYIENKNEYTVDCFVTRQGDIIATVPRLRLETAGGEVTRTVTVDRDDIKQLTCLAINSLGLTGAITLQFLEDTADEHLMLMEINPRLGGGAVTAIAAGADIPSFIIGEALGKNLSPVTDWEPGILVARYMQETVFKITP